MSNSNIFTIDCTGFDCDQGLPVSAGPNPSNCSIEAVDSTIDSVVLFDQINGNPATNWGPSMTALDFPIDNADATGVSMKRFVGIGSMSFTEGDTLELVSGSEKLKPGTFEFVITLPLPQVDNTMRDYFRTIECGKFIPRFYVTTTSGHVFGAANGLLPSKKVTAPMVLDEGGNQNVVLTLSYVARISPDRFISPLPRAADLV